MELHALVLKLLPFCLAFLWPMAILVYAVKLVWPWWDYFTRFGKLERESGISIPTISNKLGWCCFYSFSCAMFFMSLYIKYPASTANRLLFIHSGRRLLESLFITNFSARRMHIINLAAGLLFYIMTPVTLAYCSNIGSGFEHVPILICLVLNVVQFLVHKKLSSLRKYTIPRGILFNRVASPHYAAEIALYLCYFLLAPHIFTFLMFVFVCLNLTHQSIMTYQWYEARFGEEFTSLRRSIVVPFVF